MNFANVLKHAAPAQEPVTVAGYAEVLKFNPNHDELGRFASSDSTETVAQDLRHGYSTDATEDQVLHAFDSKTRSVVKTHTESIKDAVGRGQETYKLHSTTTDTGRRVYSDERKKLHAQILNGLFTPEAVAAAQAKKPTAYLLGGRGGSGKSQLSKAVNPDTGVYDPKSTIVLDPDDLKEKLGVKSKGGDGGYKGWNAYLYHEESSDLMNEALARARKLKVNVAIDQTMRSDPKKKIMGLKKAGYRVEGHYMFLPEQEAARRAVGRMVGDNKDYAGRFVPPSVVLGNKANEKNFDRNLNRFDDWTVTRNDVPKGQAPIRVASKSTHGGSK